MAGNIQIKPIGGGFAGLAARVPNAVGPALNRVARSVRAVGVKAVGDDLNAKQSAVRPAVTVVQATRGTPEAFIRFKGGRIPIYDLGARQTRAGVTHKFTGGRRLIPSAFIQTMPRTGHTGVFKRIGEKVRMRMGSRYAGQMRQPIIELFGASIPLVASKPAALDPMKAKIKERMPIEMASAARFFGKAGGG